LADTNRSADWGSLVPATRLGDQLYKHLAGLIEHGEFAEGSRLPAESELAERFRVSRPVIREALSRLRSAGIILSRKGSGSFVQKRADRLPLSLAAAGFGPITSLAQVKQSYQFRLCVESEAAYYAAQNRTAETLDTMRGALDRIERAIATGMVGMDADYEFHAAVARASGNEFFEGVMESMRTPFEFTINLARSLAMRRPMDHLLTVQAEHIRIFEAIDGGDMDAARTAMHTHVQNSCRRIFEGPDNGGERPRSLDEYGHI
jgi:GntR family transcriptional repressor for pyruvate dehydrogenase complex